jgi:hypothetical protein
MVKLQGHLYYTFITKLYYPIGILYLHQPVAQIIFI